MSWFLSQRISGKHVSVPGSQVFQIFTVAGQPVDGREMSGIGKALIQSPEAADETFGVLCDRFGEVTALWGNCSDNGDRTFCSV